jgi:hypothetical protein
MMRTSTLRGWSAPRRWISVLQGAQQLGLHGRRELAHLVQKQGALVRTFKPPGAGGHCSEKAPGMAEELALGQGVGQGSAVHMHHGLLAPA